MQPLIIVKQSKQKMNHIDKNYLISRLIFMS